MNYFSSTLLTPLPPKEPLDITQEYPLPTMHGWRVRDGVVGGSTTTVLAFTPSWVCHRRKWRVDGMDVTICGYGAHARAGLNPQSLKREVWLRSVYTIHNAHLFVDDKASMTWGQARELWSACMNFGLEYFANRKIWYGWEGKWDAV